MKETKEALVGINELAIVIATQLKDGLQVGKDLFAIFEEWKTHPEFQEKLKNAVMGIEKVPSEFKEISLETGIELASIQLAYVPKIVKALRKE